MKQFLMAVCSCVSIASFAAISVPDPVTTPASEIDWDDFGGVTRATSANWDAKDQTYSYSNGAFNMNNVSWQKGLTLNVGAGMIFTANGAWHGPIGGNRELQVIRVFDGGTFNVNGDWDPNYTQLQVDNGVSSISTPSPSSPTTTSGSKAGLTCTDCLTRRRV